MGLRALSKFIFRTCLFSGSIYVFRYDIFSYNFTKYIFQAYTVWTLLGIFFFLRSLY